MLKLALKPPQNNTVVVTLRMDDDDGDVLILFNGITVAYVDSCTGHIYKYGFDKVSADTLKASGVQLDKNGLVVFLT